MSEYLINIISNIGMITFVALSAYLLLVTGKISFGQQAYFGIGAYIAGISTTMWSWPLWEALVFGSISAGIGALIIGTLTSRLSGIHFSIATLAFSEMIRLALLSIHIQIPVDGELVGPNGAEGFGNIRWIFENNVTPFEFMLIIYSVMGSVLLLIVWLESARIGIVFRMIGEDVLLAETQGINTTCYIIGVNVLAGIIAGLGGGLYSHFTTYIEPNVFNVMLGVHSLAYGLIGGLGTAFGPLIGVILDIGFFEGIRVFQGYRMIAFGGLVAILLIFMPRGILDEKRVKKIKYFLRRY